MVETPELEKQSRARDRGSQEIGEFLEWMQGEGINFMKWGTELVDRPCSLSPGTYGCGGRGWVWFNDAHASDEQVEGDDRRRVCKRCGGSGSVDVEIDGWVHDGRRIEKLLADYFEIDLDKIEEERRALLDELRAKHEARS